MKKTYIVTIETAKGGSFATEAAIRSAVFNTAPHCDDYKAVEIAEVQGGGKGKSKAAEVETFGKETIYALGVREVRGWRIACCFDTERRATNALARSVRNFKACGLHGEMAALVRHGGAAWKMIGEAVKV